MGGDVNLNVRDVLETLKKLPAKCWIPLNSDPQLLTCIKRGESGYYPSRRFDTPEEAQAMADEMNAHEVPPVTKAQVQAMQAGSMMGWEIPAADPDMYREDGSLK